LFTDWKILEKSWELIEDIVNCDENCPIVHYYKSWTNWPLESVNLLKKDNRNWFDIID
jgi:glucose-6-phosphate 1-dehydrogenase